jgi:hypothetical protein
MPVTKIVSSTTTQIKSSAGYIKNLSVANAGTNWTLQLLDGPDPLGNSDMTVYGGTTAGAITVGLVVTNPLYFSKGIKVITSGTAGELDIDWY